MRGKTPPQTPAPKRPPFGQRGGSYPGKRCPEVPGLEQRVGRPPPARRRAPLSPARLEPDPSPWPRLISNTKPGVGRPLSTQPGAAGRAPREGGRRAGADGIPALSSTPRTESRQVGVGSTAREHLCPRALGDSEKLAVLSLPSSHRCRRPALCWSRLQPRPAANR